MKKKKDRLSKRFTWGHTDIDGGYFLFVNGKWKKLK